MSKIRHHTCSSCGKQSFDSKSDAKTHSRIVHPGDKFSFYSCAEIPENWHYGHMDGSVKDGRRDRHTFGYSAPRNVDRASIHIEEREPLCLEVSKMTVAPSPRDLDPSYLNRQETNDERTNPPHI